MRVSTLYIIILFLTCSNLLSAQGKMSDEEIAINNKLKYHRDNANKDSAIYYSDKLIQFYIKKKFEEGVVRANYQKVKTLRSVGLFDEGLQLALTIQNKYCINTVDKSENCGPCKHIYNELFDFAFVMQDYRLGISYLEKNCDNKKNEIYYYKKANLYRLINLPDSALITVKKGIFFAVENENKRSIIRAYNNYGLIAKKLKKYDIATSAFTKAIEIGKNNDLNINKYAHIIGNLGSCYYEQGDYNSAYPLLEIDAKGSLTIGSMTSFINAETFLCLIDVENKKFRKVIKRCNNLLKTHAKHFKDFQKIKVFELLMDVHKQTGNSKEYEYNLTKWKRLSEQSHKAQLELQRNLIKKYAANSMLAVTKKMELEKQLTDQKFKLKLKEEKEKQLINKLLIGGLCFSFVFLLLVFWRYRLGQKRKLLLKEARLELARKEQDILSMKVDQEAKNVKSLSLELIMKDDFSNVLVKKLNSIESLSSSEIKNVEMFIQNELAVKSVRAQLQNQMGSLSGEFYSALIIKHPNLTELDSKLAAMIVMNMSNKDIATSKNISTGSVKISKNRLKKKLNLTSIDDLTEYLKKI